MKIQIISVLAIGLLTLSCINIKSDNEENNEGFSEIFSGRKGKGQQTEKTFEGNFDAIQVSTSISANIIKSDTEKVVISAPSDIMEFIKVENNAGKLRIYVNSNFRNNISTERIKATIYTKDFNQLEANSSADILVKDTFVQDKLNVEVSSSGEIKGNLEANKLNISVGSSGSFSGKVWADYANFEVSSSGDFSVEGKLQHARIQANSSGDFNGNNLEVKEGDFQASSSGSITAIVSKKATAQASSSGDITLRKIGDAIISKSESSSGSVNIN